MVAPRCSDSGLVRRRSRDFVPMQRNRIMTGSERRYMVYGIGSGIVDQQVKITDSELEDLRLSKGFMELADQAEQGRILAYLGNRQSELHAGGSAANTIAGIARWEAASPILARWLQMSWDATMQLILRRWVSVCSGPQTAGANRIVPGARDAGQ